MNPRSHAGMKLAAAVLLLTAPVLVLAACTSEPARSYDSVRTQAIAEMKMVADRLPEGTTIERQPEQDPYPCNDRVGISSQPGDSYTGNWEITTPAGFDVPTFIHTIPKELGDGWAKQDDLPRLNHAWVSVTDQKTGVVISINEIKSADIPATMQMIGISACGSTPSPAS